MRRYQLKYHLIVFNEGPLNVFKECPSYYLELV